MRNPSDIQVNGTTLDVVLARHLEWLQDKGGVRANLHHVDLQYVNLQYANLQGAHMQGANLYHADLQGANLQGANLKYADLRRADLQYVDLRRADLGNSRIVRMDFGSWPVCITRDSTQIGCLWHPNEKWLEWEPESEEIRNMHPKATQFWTDHKDMIRAGIRWAMAEPTKEG